MMKIFSSSDIILDIRLIDSLIESDDDSYQKHKILDVWRAISIDKPDVALKLKALGTFWADEKDKATVYWGQKKPYYAVFHAQVNQDQIDHEKTMYMRSNPRFAGEDEIRLRDFEKIFVKEVEIFKILSRSEYMDAISNGTAGKPIKVIKMNAFRSSGKSLNE
jgi:hypothetical protein